MPNLLVEQKQYKPPSPPYGFQKAHNFISQLGNVENPIPYKLEIKGFEIAAKEQN